MHQRIFTLVLDDDRLRACQLTPTAVDVVASGLLLHLKNGHDQLNLLPSALRKLNRVGQEVQQYLAVADTVALDTRE